VVPNQAIVLNISSFVVFNTSPKFIALLATASKVTFLSHQYSLDKIEKDSIVSSNNFFVLGLALSPCLTEKFNILATSSVNFVYSLDDTIALVGFNGSTATKPLLFFKRLAIFKPPPAKIPVDASHRFFFS